MNWLGLVWFLEVVMAASLLLRYWILVKIWETLDFGLISQQVKQMRIIKIPFQKFQQICSPTLYQKGYV